MLSSQHFASAIPKNETKTCISEATLCWACTNYISCEFFFYISTRQRVDFVTFVIIVFTSKTFSEHYTA